ncbi:hypothetical protein [Jannaschia ovalis]|uniref:Uncharacterized protein n=1 Tax=Jannaschia ovalis TaxID=3038773 RepID=A0ABY8LAR3_9RHOB|nr:hypothetical protein [Jannaschia sp. GRR-S6-38]WGH77478.1 hypothetical protein P8627_10535 [Jannaschia sp. GRR-S6-38]
MIELRIGPEGATPVAPPSSDTAQGLVFQKTAPVGDGSLRRMEEVGLRPLAFGYVADSYGDGWEGFEKRLFDILSPPLEQALLVVSVNEVMLEYQNVFVYDGGPDEYKELTLFKQAFAHMNDQAIDPFRHWEVQISWGAQEPSLSGWGVLYQRAYRGVQFGTPEVNPPRPAMQLVNTIRLGARQGIQDDLNVAGLRRVLGHAHSALHLQLIDTLAADMNDSLNLRREKYISTS